MKSELLKILVQAVVIERNDEGNIMGEKLGDPTALYTRDHVLEFFDKVREENDRG